MEATIDNMRLISDSAANRMNLLIRDPNFTLGSAVVRGPSPASNQQTGVYMTAETEQSLAASLHAAMDAASQCIVNAMNAAHVEVFGLPPVPDIPGRLRSPFSMRLRDRHGPDAPSPCSPPNVDCNGCETLCERYLRYEEIMKLTDWGPLWSHA